MSTVLMLIAVASVSADADRGLKVTSARWLPKFEEVIVYRSKDVAPGKPLPAKPLFRFTDLGQAATLPDEGPFEVFARPKGGLLVRVAHDLKMKPDASTIKLGDALGVVEVFGDNFPRAEAIVLTATDDPGPGEKGHAAVQSATDYRLEMAVPAGNYAVWVKPANGARAQKVSDNVRVLAGRSVRVE